MGSTAAPSLQQQQASMASPRQARPGRVQWAPDRGGPALSLHERLPKIAEGAGLQQGSELQGQQLRRKQPSGQQDGDARGPGSLLARTGLFRSRSSSDREEARASEMSLVTRSPSAQQGHHHFQQQAQLVSGQVHQENAQQEQGLRSTEQREQHPLSTGNQGHLALPMEPSWAQEGEELSGDFLLGSRAGGDAALDGRREVAAEQHGHFPFAGDRGGSPQGMGGSFDRGSAQLIAPPHGWHAGRAVHELQSAHSGGLFEPLHEAMLESPSGAHASAHSSLAWHDDELGPPDLEGDLEAGWGGSLGSSLHGSHEGMDRGVDGTRWDAHGL